MDLTFKTARLRKQCNDETAMVRRHGTKRAGRLKRRLIQLRAAKSLGDLGPPYHGPARCHEMTGNYSGVFSVDLDHPYRLLFRPDHNPIPTRKEGGIDWERVTAVEILGIEDTHG